jgi:hypothetical protein
MKLRTLSNRRNSPEIIPFELLWFSSNMPDHCMQTFHDAGRQNNVFTSFGPITSTISTTSSHVPVRVLRGAYIEEADVASSERVSTV